MVPRPRTARRAIVCAIAALATAACAAGDAGGAPFDANGTLDDLAAVTAAFDAPAVASFIAASPAIDAALEGPVAPAAVRLLADHDDAVPGARSREFVLRAAGFAHADAASPRLAAVGALPARALGTTWTWDAARARYVNAYAPAESRDAARFTLYALDPATGRPAVPLRAIGWAELREAGRGAEMAVQVRVVAGATVPLEYTVAAAEAAGRATVTVQGTALHGGQRLAFRLAAGFDPALAEGRLDVRLDAPARGLSLDWSMGPSDLAGTRPLPLDVLASGPHGNVVLDGQLAADGSGRLGVLANGVAFADIARGPTAVTVLRTDGTPAAPSEQGALLGILATTDEGGALFTRLLEPVDNVVR